MPRELPEAISDLIDASSRRLRDHMERAGNDEDEVDAAVIELEGQIKRAYFASVSSVPPAARRSETARSGGRR